MATQPQQPGRTSLYISHRTFMEMQVKLMEPGSEFEWIRQNAAAFRDWVESFAEIIQEPDPTLDAVELLVLVPRRLRHVQRSLPNHAERGRRG